MSNIELPYVGDVGTKIYVDCIVTISSASVAKLYVMKPGKIEVEWTATVSDVHTLVYTVTAGDFSVAGVYKVNAYVELPDGIWTGRVDKITVHARYT